MKNILVVLGTRPEVIKLAPLIIELRKHTEKYNVIICNTEQQKELSNQTLSFFGLKANIVLDVMLPNQTLLGVQSIIMTKLAEIYSQYKIDATIVQGDTMSVFCGALASFYNKIPIFHIEAGLRSYSLFEPFPEEGLRQMVSRIVDLHFAPTQDAVNALLKEGVSEDKIILSGNTVIDALYCLPPKEFDKSLDYLSQQQIKLDDKLVLITAHRRENHGERLDNIIESIKCLAEKYTDHQFVIPVHPNPNVKQKIIDSLNAYKNIILLPPIDYPILVTLMKNAKLILTDSGGIQEEAPTFGVPVLVMRYETERKEGVSAGFAKLVGADYNNITREASNILSKDITLTRKDGNQNPYGNGDASFKIEKGIDAFLMGRKEYK